MNAGLEVTASCARIDLLDVLDGAGADAWLAAETFSSPSPRPGGCPTAQSGAPPFRGEQWTVAKALVATAQGVCCAVATWTVAKALASGRF